MTQTRTSHGSIVLMTLLLITAFSAIVYSMLRTTSYCVSLAREREKYEVHYQLARSLRDFVVVKYIDQLKNSNSTEKITFFKGPWPDKESGYSGVAWLDKKKGSIRSLHTDIIKNKKTLISLNRPFPSI